MLRDYSAILMICALFILVFAPGAKASIESAATRFALVPLANYSEFNEARDSVESAVKSELEQRCNLITGDSLRDFMRSNRLRLVGVVNSVAASELNQGLGVRFVVTGAIEIYQPGELPELSLCLRVYDCRSLEVVWAKCVSAAGEDYGGLLGIGETSSMSKVTSRVIRELMKDFDSHFAGSNFKVPKVSKQARKLLQSGKLAVIPCDHSTLYLTAGDVVSDLLLAEVWQLGYPVAEPGDVTRILTRSRQLYIGSATEVGMKELSDSLNVTALVSGTVFEFLPLRGRVSQAGPVVGLSLRLTDPQSGVVLSAVNDQRNGATVNALFGSGREYSIGRTTQSLVETMWKRLVRERRTGVSSNKTIQHETVQR
jgi:hypothetical protein